MKKKTSKNVVWVIVALAMICLCLTTIGLGLYYFFNRGQSSANQPIVWITIPTNHQVFTAGDSSICPGLRPFERTHLTPGIVDQFTFGKKHS